MKRFAFIFIVVGLYGCKNKCPSIGERTGLGYTCGYVTFQSTNRGRDLKIVFEKNSEVKRSSIIIDFKDTIDVGKDTIYTIQGQDVPGDVQVVQYFECSSCDTTAVRPLNMLRIDICLSCGDVVSIDTNGNLEVLKGDSSLPSGRFYIKLEVSGNIYVIGLDSDLGDVKISTSTVSSLATDTSEYSDTVLVYGDHALWLNTDSPDIDTEDIFGKFHLSTLSPDSISVIVGLRTGIKGLRWIK